MKLLYALLAIPLAIIAHTCHKTAVWLLKKAAA